jgi:maltose alpha-D-glucosyltransferase/alpha-amylase
MNPEQLRSAFEKLDRRGLRLDRDDLLVLLACTRREGWETFFDAAESFASLKQHFLDDPADAGRFKKLADCLLTLCYGTRAPAFKDALGQFLEEQCHPAQPDWVVKRGRAKEEFRRDVVYELYVDLFAENFRGLIDRLDYLKDLGVNVLWLLPFLDSPGDDDGFDQANRRRIWPKLGAEDDFRAFAEAARERGLSIMMDLVINHRSWKCDEYQASSHPDPHSPERQEYGDYFIWCEGDRDTPPQRYKCACSRCRDVIAPCSGQGILGQAGKEIEIPWSWNERRGAWYFHYFLPQQPDVNYDNPRVLIDDLSILKYWLETGTVSYVRLDAIHCLFKRDHEDLAAQVLEVFPEARGLVDEDYCCNELPQVHMAVRLISAFLTHRYAGWVGIASEDVSPIEKWEKYFGEGVGAQLNYQFYRMQGLWASLVRGERTPLAWALPITTNVPRHCAGIMMARVHDELSFEHAEAVVTRMTCQRLMRRLKQLMSELPEAEYSAYQRIKEMYTGPGFNPEEPYNFAGRGIAARMSTVLRALPPNPVLSEEDDLVEKYRLILSLIMSLEDIPLIYMGDEWGEPDHWLHLLEVSKKIGGLDMRRMHRPIADCTLPQRLLAGEGPPLAQKIYKVTKTIIAARQANSVMMYGNLIMLPDAYEDDALLAFLRCAGEERVLVVSNLGLARKRFELSLDGVNVPLPARDLLTGQLHVPLRRPPSITVDIEARQSVWLRLS